MTEERLDFNIGEIGVIVYKAEDSHFDYTCTHRAQDGFVLITEGVGELYSPEEKWQGIRGGDLIIVRRGDNYRFKFNTPCAYITSAFNITSAKGFELPRIWHPSDYYFQSILSMAKIWSRQGYDRDLACRIGLLELFRALICEKRAPVGGTELVLSRAKDFIHKSFKRNFTAEEIAASCAVSPSYLRALFVKNNGITITEYRDSLRLKAAKEMLDSGMFAIKEISDELGFCDVYYFTKFFKKAAGASPASYRKGEKKQ